MADSGGAGSCTVRLRLDLVTDENIKLDGVKFAQYLQQHLHIFQTFIQSWKNVHYAKVTDVTFDSENIYISFEFNDEKSLDAFYEYTKKPNNELSQRISAFLHEQSQDLAAALRLTAKIACELQMTKREFLQGQIDLCPDDSSQLQKRTNGEKNPPDPNIHYEVETEKHAVTSVQKRAKVFDDSINTRAQRPSDSNSHEQNNKDSKTQSNESKPVSQVSYDPVIRKQFILYYPPVPNGWKVSKVCIETSFGILKKASTERRGNLYEVTIEFPLKWLEQQESMYFQYVVFWKKAGIVGKLASEYHDKSKDLKIGSLSPQRDLWAPKSLKDPQIDIISGYQEQLKDMLFNNKSNNTCNETSIEIETFCTKKLTKEEAVMVLKQLAALLKDANYHSFSSLMFLITCGCLLTRHEIIANEKVVDAECALKIMQAIHVFRMQDLTTSNRRILPLVCYQFCRIGLGDKLCGLSYLSKCYPFYDDDAVLEKIQRHVTTRAKICPDSENMFPFANEICSKLYRKAISEETHTAKSILDKLLRHLPLSVALHVFLCHNKIDMDDSSKESDVQSVLYGSISVQLERMLVVAKTSGTLNHILNCWRIICTCELLVEKFRGNFEDAVIIILGSHSVCPGSLSETISSFIDQSGFFKELSKQRKLISAVAKSSDRYVNKLFVSLASNTTMYECYMNLETEQFREYCLCYVTGNSVRISREHTFERLKEIWVMQQIQHKRDFQKVWENMLLEEFQRYRLRELLQKLKSIDSLSSENESIANVFLQYVRTSLASKYDNFHPEEIFRWLDGTTEKPLIENKLSALVLNELVDTYGSIQNSRQVCENFQHLVESCSFWRSLFAIEGKYAAIVKENGHVKEVRNCVLQMVELFQRHEISYDFVLAIESNMATCLAAKALLQLECSRKEIDQYWSEALMKFKEEKEKLQRVQRVVSSVSNRMNSRFSVSGFESIRKHMHNAEVQLTCGKMTAKECIKENLTWKGMEHLPALCEYLDSVVSSNVFWNLCTKTVTEEFRISKGASVDDNDPVLSLCTLFQEISVKDNVEGSVNESMHFLDILLKTGIQIYKETWRAFLFDENFKMEDVYHMFGWRPNISHEISIARRLLLYEISEAVVKTLERVYGIKNVEMAVNSVMSVLKAFKTDIYQDAVFSSAFDSFKKLKTGRATDYNFADVQHDLETIFSSIRNLSDSTVAIMEELGKSTSLIGFLQEIVDEDIRNLIDAVEDISEQQVRESTVSALIEVKRYVQPLLIASGKRNCQELIHILETQTRCSRSNPIKMPAKIADCMAHLHNLKSLYNNVANRGEQTKEMIRNIIKRGTFVFRLDKENDLVDFEVNYKQRKNKETRQKSTLIDLRSRALLLMNTERKDLEESHFQPEELSMFVDYINLCLDITECLSDLYSSGYIEGSKMRTLVKPTDLKQKKESVHKLLDSWCRDLRIERESHYLMNFIRGIQIQVLLKYLEGNETEVSTVQTMLKFIHPHMQVKVLRSVFRNEKEKIENWNEQSVLYCIGCTMHNAFQTLHHFERPITADTNALSKKITDRVQTSKLLVAKLVDGSIQTVKTVLGLYLNTTQRLPEPNQVLFCTRLTTGNEIALLIKRCLGAYTFYGVKPLFCIANVELLPSKMQFQLVDTLKHLERDFKYLLAIVCRGSRNHPFIEELNEYGSSVNPATDKTVRQIFKEHCSDVVTITSDEAGQGKTCIIHKLAHEKRKGLVTLHISGPLQKSVLIERLLSLNIKVYHSLHIDIGNVEDPTELDTFLFELVVLRYVSDGKVSFSLKTEDIKIEVANTVNNTLKDALQTAMLFTRRHIKWKGLNAFVISKEKQSPTQTTCKYLDALEKHVLDIKDIIIDEAASKPLSRKRCRYLLQQYLGDVFCTSFPVLHTFLNVLADQLKKLSRSSFFRVTQLRDMIGRKDTIHIKSKLVRAMVEMSKEFAKRSIEECREAQNSTIRSDFEGRGTERQDETFVSCIVERINGMIRWEESNHLVFVFHNQNIQTLSALYRTLDKVEDEVKYLFESQMEKPMADYSKMSQEDLQNMLQKVARTNPLRLKHAKLADLSQNYALTADNLLKMILIMLRIKANVPIVVMGETGCGKTSLIRYLAEMCEVKFDVMNIHAGVTENEIVEKVRKANDLAFKNFEEERWLFLDEINTSENICMIADTICHHSCLDKELSPNLVVLAACNPYKLRSTKAISTAGLDSKVRTDELSRLVYRVLPLPEMLVDYVWDFGSLSEQDEEKYIYRMTDDVFPKSQKMHDLLTNLLSASQDFVREKESSAYSVSLRDIQRCKQLTKWFVEVLPKKGLIKESEKFPCEINIKAVILALAHCYYCRFAEKLLRKQYLKMISNVLALQGIVFGNGHDEFLLGIVREEQKDILDRMQLPPGTARNTALQENVFVILVCIFNRIPIFVVGKPGCSKSLAIQLIRSNLRGKDSEDDFFKSLPHLYCVSFQGSESSTSDGILKVFEKADKYQMSNNREDVMSVVILDEIGLAEISRFNPLKVLHDLLEPDGQSHPNVAVVGISNWALDASKMNRAIHLSRTEMDVDELFHTAMSISESFLDSEALKSQTLFDAENVENAVSTKDIEVELQGMAEAYFRYTEQMRFKNFHGLRDYYSLVKYVARMFAEKGRILEGEEKAELIVWGLERNFGGLPAERQTLHAVFSSHVPMSVSSKHTVIDLITQNVQDPIARHLMLITTGESVLGIIETNLHDIGCDRIEIIYGSHFEEDLVDDYNYRILSRIILCMEEGVILILKDLESIYGSLYDMLNQNYTVIGKKKNCRVALGPYSNPICHVADSFRCVVLIDESKLDRSDPPFLNRFEKQHLRFFDIIRESQRGLINDIESWVQCLTFPGSNIHEKREIFAMYNEDLVASLVLKYDRVWSSKLDFSGGFAQKVTLFNACQKELLWVIRPEIIVRFSMSDIVSERPTASEIVTEYFSLPIHDGLNELISYQLAAEVPGVGILAMIFTNSNVHTQISQLFECTVVQVEKVGTFKSEKQLSSNIKRFWERTDCSILIVQCNAREDDKHVMLTKLVIERYRRDYQQKKYTKQKHVYLIIHLDRSKDASSSVMQLNFLSDWKLVLLDSIDRPKMTLPELCKMTLLEAIQEKRPLCEYLKEKLFWAFTRIKYGMGGRDVSSLTSVIAEMENSKEFLEVLDNEVWNWILMHQSSDGDKTWQMNVACNAALLNTSTSFVDALETYILDIIKKPLSKYIYKIELCGVLDSFFVRELRCTQSGQEIENIDERRQVLISLLQNKDLFSIDDIPDESGPECYACHTIDLSLQMPFSLLIFDKIEKTKEVFLDTVKKYRIQCLLDEDEELPREVFEEVLFQQEEFIVQSLPNLKLFQYKQWGDDYFDDFCNIFSYRICPTMLKRDRTDYAKLIMEQSVRIDYENPFLFIIRLHTTSWVQFPILRAEMLLIESSLKVVPGIQKEIRKVLYDLNRTVVMKDRTKYNSIPLESTESIWRVETNTRDDIEKDDVLKKRNSQVKANSASELDLKELNLDSPTLNLDENTTAVNSFVKDDKSFSVTYSVDDYRDSGVSFEQSSKPPVSENNQNTCSLKAEHVMNPETLRILENTNIDSIITKEICSEGSSQNTKGDETFTAKELLVEFLCKKMIPTTHAIKYHCGIQQWYRKVSSALSLAYQVTRSPKLLYSLRVCIELSASLIIPFDLKSSLLEEVGDLLNDEYEIDSTEVFQKIIKVIKSALEVKQDFSTSQACVRMLSSYWVMCISSEPETCASEIILSQITDSIIPDQNMHLLRAPISLSFSLIERHLFVTLLSEVQQSNSKDEFDLESNSDLDNCHLRECNFFRILNQMVIDIFEKKMGDHKFIVLLTDIFQDLYTEILKQDEPHENQVNTNPESEREDTDSLVSINADEIFLTCHKLLRKRTFCLRWVAAVAYFKAFVEHNTQQLQFLENDTFFKTMSLFDAVLSDGCDVLLCRCLLTYFLKVCSRDKTLRRLETFCNYHQNHFKFLKNVEWTKGYRETCLENSPICIFADETLHKESCSWNSSLEVNSYKLRMEKIVYEATKTVQGMISFFGLAIKEFYLFRFNAPFDDTKCSTAALVVNEAIKLEIGCKEVKFLKCVTGEENFSFHEYDLTEEVTDKQFCKMSFFISIYAIGFGHCKLVETGVAGVLTQCLCFPRNMKTCMFPGFPDSENETVLNSYLEQSSGHLAICHCGNLLAFYKDKTDYKCIVCGAYLKAVKNRDSRSQCFKLKSGLLAMLTKSHPFFIVRGLQPVSRHILQLLVKVCLLGSIAVCPAELANVADLIDVPETDVCSVLWESLSSHWDNLCELLNVDNYILLLILHTVVKESMDMLFVARTPDSTEELLSWESHFELVVKNILQSRYAFLQNIVSRHDRLHAFDDTVIEQRIREFDTQTKEESDLRLLSLCRVIAHPSKSNFLSEFYPNRSDFPLLTLVLQNEHMIKLPQHIYNIINWHNATVANANYTMRKSECFKMSVQDFIYSEQENKNEKSDVIWDRFEAFRESWEYLMEHLQTDDINNEMTRIHSESKMAECLLLGKSTVVYQVLESLIEIQNNLIRDVLAVANRCEALQFLFKDIDVAVFPSVQVTDVKKEELISCNCDWKGLLQKDSQCSLEYGHGRQIHYDFKSIEQRVAVDVFSGKAHLSLSENLPRIVFIDELHKNYSSLIRELKFNINQESLPPEIVNGIKARNEEDPRMATELLTHLGIVMSLLKKTKPDPERSLVEYVDGWKSLLSHSFPKKLLPSQENCVRLCHVVALSELLEELCADSVKNGLSDDFRCKLDAPLKDYILKSLKYDQVTIIVLKGIKRFTYRCLSTRIASANQSLREYLLDDTFWPDKCLVDDCLIIGDRRVNLADVFPDGMMVRHTFECLSIIEKELQKRRQGNIKMSKFATSFQANIRSSPSEKVAEKRRKASKFRKF